MQLVTPALLELCPVQKINIERVRCNQRLSKQPRTVHLGVCPSAERRRTIGWLSPCWFSGCLLPASALNFLPMYVYTCLRFSFCCLFGWILPVFLIFHLNPSGSLGTANRLLLWSFLLSQDVRLRVSLTLVMLMDRSCGTRTLSETFSSHLGAFFK